MQRITFTFGDKEDLSHEVLALLRAGKTPVICATACMLTTDTNAEGGA